MQDLKAFKRIHELKFTQQHFNQFYESWWNDKCQVYQGESLSNHYDLFFSRYVTYNALYDVIVHIKERTGKLEKKDRGDKVKATTCMVQEFSAEHLELQRFFSLPEIGPNVRELEGILEKEKFGVSFARGSHNSIGDKKS